VTIGVFVLTRDAVNPFTDNATVRNEAKQRKIR